MRNLIIVAICLITLAGCKEKPNVLPKQVRAMNPVEQQILGKWYLKEKKDVTVTGGVADDTTYGPYPGAWFVRFENTMNDQYNSILKSKLYLVMQDAAIHHLETFGGFTDITPSSVETYWYFDTSTNKLLINGRTYVLDSISETDMMIKVSVVNNVKWMTYWLKK